MLSTNNLGTDLNAINTVKQIVDLNMYVSGERTTS